MRLCAVWRAGPNFIHFHNGAVWPGEMKKVLKECCTVIPNFISEEEEASLLNEINPHMKRMRYEKSHWDDVCFVKFNFTDF